MSAKSLQSCPILCDPWTVALGAPLSMGFPASILEWVAISFSRGSSHPGIQPLSLSLLHWQVGSIPLVLPQRGKKEKLSTKKLKDPELCTQNIQRHRFQELWPGPTFLSGMCLLRWQQLSRHKTSERGSRLTYQTRKEQIHNPCYSLLQQVFTRQRLEFQTYSSISVLCL